MGELFDSVFLYFSGLLEVVLEIIFYGRFVGKRGTAIQNILFVVFGCVIINLPIEALLKLVLFIAALSFYGIWVLNSSSGTAILYAILTAEIMQLCFGVFNSITMVLSSFVYDIDPAVFSKVFMIAGNLLALGLTCLCYLGVFKCLERKEDIQNQYVLMILTPLLMILVVSEYISHTFYGNVISVEQASDFLIGNHIQMLAVQTLGLISIFAIMYAYQKLSVAFSTSRKLSLLEQQSHFQKQYVEEAQTHYDSTKALRHDMKNQIAGIYGYLETGELEEGKREIRSILKQLEKAEQKLFTANAVVNGILNMKYVEIEAKQIEAKLDVKLPEILGITGTDLGVLFGNILDNAIEACESCKKEKWIDLFAVYENHGIVICCKNSCSETVMDLHTRKSDKRNHGFGLSSVKQIAEKYNGDVWWESEKESFTLNINLWEKIEK